MRTAGQTLQAELAAIEARPYAEFMPHSHVGAALEAVAERHPTRNALAYLTSAEPEAPVECWTYADFIGRLRQVAQALRMLAAPEPPRVALLAPPVPQAWLVFWAAESAGLVCPINPQLGASSVAALVRAARANLLVCLGEPPDLDISGRLAGLRQACPGLREVLALGRVPGALDFASCIGGQPAPPLAAPDQADAELHAALFHTGGTTGAPKLWPHTHRNQLHAAWGGAQLMGLRERDVVFNGFPMFHVAGPLVYGLSTLLAGGCVLLPSAQGMRNKALLARWGQVVQAHRVSLISCVPTFVSSLLGCDVAGADLGSLRAVFTGGAPLPAALVQRFEQRLGVPVRNVLGMTECAGTISVEPAQLPRGAGSCGWPIPFTTVQVSALDAVGTPLPAGATGMLCVGGPGVGRGYVAFDSQAPSAPFDAAGRLVTGDLGHIDAEGRVTVTGRAKDLIIRGGHNIDPALIEQALLAHPAVQMAAAVGQPDEYAGELPVAFVSLQPGACVDADQLMAYARAGVAEPAACPRRIEVLQALPLTPIGKVYKTALRLRAIEQVLGARLVVAGLGTAGISVQGVDDDGRLTALFRFAAGAPSPQQREAIDGLMADFALAYRLQATPRTEA
jgi:fatty-acyl-CoA synthase